MRRRDLLALAGAASLAGPHLARAQGQMKRIGVLMPNAESDPESVDLGAVFRQSMQELGWIGGRTARIDYRWGGGDQGRINNLAQQMVAGSPDVIFAGGYPAVAPLKRATSTIPIVFISVSDPIGAGFVQSLAHPGGNLTGFTSFEPSMGGKWLDLLKQAAPGVRRASVLYNPATAPYTNRFLDALKPVAPNYGVTISAAAVRDEGEIESAAAALEPGGDASLLVPSDAFTLTHAQAVIAAAARHRLPAVYAFRVFAENGGLLSYGVDLGDQMRQAAKYVDRILSGTSPADLPVQQPTRFELLINLKTAKSLGLTVPPALLASATEVIE
jgi:putative tryptophan/tyrosine transport system substrate-binding protein